MERVEIIVLKYELPEVEKRCINSIIDHTEIPYKLNVYDTRQTVCHFSKIWNKLVKESTEEYICIMDSDVVVSAGWLEALLECYQKNDCVLAVPSSENIGTPAQMHVRNQGVVEMGMASPVVGLYHKSSFEKVGYFDESPEFSVFGQDAEWVRRAIKKGFKIYMNSNIFVNHIGNASTSKASQEGKFDFNAERERAAKKIKQLYE